MAAGNQQPNHHQPNERALQNGVEDPRHQHPGPRGVHRRIHLENPLEEPAENVGRQRNRRLRQRYLPAGGARPQERQRVQSQPGAQHQEGGLHLSTGLHQVIGFQPFPNAEESGIVRSFAVFPVGAGGLLAGHHLLHPVVHFMRSPLAAQRHFRLVSAAGPGLDSQTAVHLDGHRKRSHSQSIDSSHRSPRATSGPAPRVRMVTAGLVLDRPPLPRSAALPNRHRKRSHPLRRPRHQQESGDFGRLSLCRSDVEERQPIADVVDVPPRRHRGETDRPRLLPLRWPIATSLPPR